MQIKYVGKRPRYADGIYGTGEWEQGQTKPVPAATAALMLRHRDQYQESEEPSFNTCGAVFEMEYTPEDADMDQDFRDLINTMNKEQLAQFALEKFQAKLPRNMRLENARSKVIGLLDQYGAE